MPGGKARRLDHLTQPVDLFPTLVELAGLPVPEDIDGTSLLPLFQGETVPQRPVAVTSPGLTVDPAQPVCSAITDGVWALQYRGPDYPAELHNLRADPAQQTDLYAAHRGEAERLHGAYVEFLRAVGTPDPKLALRRGLP